MKLNRITCFLLLSWLAVSSCSKDPADRRVQESTGLVTPQPFHLVELQDSFWAPRLDVQYQTLIPFAFEKTKLAVENLGRTAALNNGFESELPFAHRYISSDLYKVMEGAAYILQVHPDPQLEAKMDSIITIIGDAQLEDGYLYVAHIAGVAGDHAAWGGGGMGDRPYSHLIHSHELYNMGHMYEAAVAYYQATGKDHWLQIAEKNAKHVYRVFFEGDPDYNEGKPVMQAPGHQEIELGLMKLYRVTGDTLYLNMANRFLQIRGVTYIPEGDQYMSPTYAQQHAAPQDQREAVGHAVRAGYMYSSMAEVDALQEKAVYKLALDSIWHDIVDRKMHITGGLGAQRGIEGFGEAYELPNAEAYNETCAAVANVFFNYRMFLKTRDAKYMDVAEISLYNNALAGVALSGDRFFYVNPLEASGGSEFNFGQTGRSPWFNTACCPSNIARLIPQVSGMMYAYSENDIYVNIYGGNTSKIPLKNGEIKLTQETGYPYDGKVRLKLDPENEQWARVYLRIPSWTGKALLPGKLYKYLGESDEAYSLELNGEPVEFKMVKGFAEVERNWKPGDELVLSLPMIPRFSSADERIEADRGKIAVSRGPLVYCAEEVDNPGTFEGISIRPELISEQEIGIAKDHRVISIDVASSQGSIRLIPYYAWNNRGDGAMQVWLKELR